MKDGPLAGRRVPVETPLILGRSAADITIDDPLISRRHLLLRPAESSLEIQDLGSTNGTWVNGLRVHAATRLGPGDVVQVGSAVFELERQPALTGVVLTPPEIAAAARAAVQAPAAVSTPASEPGTGEPVPGIPAAAARVPDNGIQVENLVREFGGRRAVDGVSLEVEPGGIYGFLGPNGAGKSTTVHMLTTLLPPTAGTARVAGYDIVTQGAKVRARIGVALQEAALDPLMNAWEHMDMQTALQGVPKAERKRRAQALIERVGLIDAAGRRVGGYSGGMRRRLDLALSLVHDPVVLFLDEPTTGLDPKSRSDLWEEVRRLAKEEGVTVFLTTQYLEEADLLADRVGIIDRGTIVAEGTPAELKAQIGRPTLDVMPRRESDRAAIEAVLSRFGTPSPAAHKGVAVRLERGVGDLAEVVRALDVEQLSVAEVNVHAPTLDDVFLAKTGRSLEVQEPEAEPVPAS